NASSPFFRRSPNRPRARKDPSLAACSGFIIGRRRASLACFLACASGCTPPRKIPSLALRAAALMLRAAFMRPCGSLFLVVVVVLGGTAGRGLGLALLDRQLLVRRRRVPLVHQPLQAVLASQRVLLHLVEQRRQVVQRLGVLLGVLVIQAVDPQIVPE